jgi:hypothetical protein
MAKKNSKRPEWTKTDIRELKTLARAKTPAGKPGQSTSASSPLPLQSDRASFAGAYSITTSASASRVGGNSMPSALAVLRLTVSSNLAGCSTGRLAASAPFNILST